MEERDAEGSDDMFDELVSCVIILQHSKVVLFLLVSYVFSDATFSPSVNRQPYRLKIVRSLRVQAMFGVRGPSPRTPSHPRRGPRR